MARAPMTVSITAALALGVVLTGAPTSAASAETSTGQDTVLTDAPTPDTFLARPRHGEVALERLGDDVAEVAALNDLSVPAFEDLLLEDASAWVTPTGRVLYVDPAPTDIDPQVAEAAPYPYDQTFALHSRPGSSRTIYLDFDGHTVSGTAFNEMDQWLLADQAHPAFSLDGDASTFSNAERDLIQSVWQRVSEDYAPFDVDVTTADPGPEALRRSSGSDSVFGTRALITPSDAAAGTLCDNQCGGIAFVGTYGVSGSDDYQPAWIFPQQLSNDTKAIAEGVTHEVGHNLGLDHDAAPGEGYYAGHGAWAPIMGGAYDLPISQWSAGEYAGADNTEDDLAVITQNGLSYVVDDHGDTVAAATAVTSSDRSATGVVSQRNDRDVFAFPQACADPVTITVTPAPTSPNLDVRLRVLSAAGTQLASADPASALSSYDVASGLGASAVVTPTAGTTLYAEVDGVGAGDPATNGYSDYASLGRYTITSTGCPSGTVGFSQSAATVSESAGTAELTVVRTGNLSSPATVAYSRTGGTATPGDDFSVSAGTVSFAAGDASETIPVAVTNDAADEGDETVVVTLNSPSSGTVLGAATSTLTITDDDEPAAPDPVEPVDPDPVEPAFVSFASAVQSTPESGTALLTVTRSGSTTDAVSVGYSATGGTASSLSDYLLDSGRLSFAAGQTTKTIPVTIAPDALDEADETVVVTLSSPTGATISPTATTTLTVLDDDEPVVVPPVEAQPDLLIAKSSLGTYAGDGVYGRDGSSQTMSSGAPRGGLRSFFVKVTNDGTVVDTIYLLGTRAGKGVRVTYWYGRLDITQYMTTGISELTLAPGDGALLRVDVQVSRKAVLGSTKSVWVTATSADGERSDVVRGIVKVKRS